MSLRNDSTHADEAVKIVRGILYVLTAFVIYLSYNYYIETFQEMFSEEMAWIFAVAIPIVVELGKIRLASKSLRSFWFGWINAGTYNSLYWSFIFILCAGTYYWSYKISTGGIKEVAKENATIKNQQKPLPDCIAAATADVDAKIKALDDSDANASGMRTRRGKIAWSGQSILMNNADSKKQLSAERAAIVTQVTADYGKNAVNNEGKVNRWASFVERFGGWGEFGTLLCLLIISFFEKRLYEANKADLMAAGNPQQSPASSPITFHKKGSYAANNSPYNSANGNYGAQFRWTGYGEQSAPDNNSVSHPEAGVSHHNAQAGTFGSDAVLETARTAVLRDLPNFDSSKHSNLGVSTRINKALDACLAEMNKPGFCPSREMGIKFYAFLMDRVFAELAGRGYPYTNDNALMERLLAVLPAEQVEA